MKFAYSRGFPAMAALVLHVLHPRRECCRWYTVIQSCLLSRSSSVSVLWASRGIRRSIGLQSSSAVSSSAVSDWINRWSIFDWKSTRGRHETSCAVHVCCSRCSNKVTCASHAPPGQGDERETVLISVSLTVELVRNHVGLEPLIFLQGHSWDTQNQWENWEMSTGRVASKIDVISSAF